MTIDFKNDLNPAQYEAATHGQGPVLVIAGAGSGKTRTIVYRLAHLIQQGVPQESILLLTFTRKASQEMVYRAGALLGTELHGANGSTFHSFAFTVLRRYAHALGMGGVTVLDQADAQSIVKQAKEELQLGKGDRSFPKKSTVMGLISKCRNKETDLEPLLTNEAFHLLHYAEDMERIRSMYGEIKKRHGLFDYDDLLFKLEDLFRERPDILESYCQRFSHIMVDEYQDTNLVQARLVRLLAGDSGNVMAVGDDAQSIYGFRGATVNNILDFPKIFKGTTIVRLEQNYRSTQQVLDLTNHILDGAASKFDKTLFSDNKAGPLPRIIHPLSDRSQAERVADLVREYARESSLNEVAVLFRAGYQSFALEVELKKRGVEYRKYGGMKFYEAAHIKDVLAFLRVLGNPANHLAWRRVMDHVKGVGQKTCDRLVDAMLAGDSKKVDKARKSKPELADILDFLTPLRGSNAKPKALLEQVLAFYDPTLQVRYADDYPRRRHGLDELAQMAAKYDDLETFLGDTSLDPKEEDERGSDQALTLSTVHSAKGLEWDAVIVLDLVEERFPSKRAMSRPEDLEEERRLLYVACTRARKHLALSVPSTIYNRYTQFSESAVPSVFVLELPDHCHESWHEGYSGAMTRRGDANAPSFGTGAVSPRTASAIFPDEFPEDEESAPDNPAPKTDPSTLGFCRHKIFGRGKVIARIPPDKCRVLFPGFGLKVIIEEYLEMVS